VLCLTVPVVIVKLAGYDLGYAAGFHSGSQTISVAMGLAMGPKRIVWRQTVPAAVDWQGHLMKETVTSYRQTRVEPDLSRGSLQVLEKSGEEGRTRTESSARSQARLCVG
jgi:hypothetical protein